VYGLVNAAVEGLIVQEHGRDAWNRIREHAGVPDEPFLAMQAYPDELTYKLVEHSGRWGMLDVLLVAVLVAALKLGDLVAVEPGPGATVFATFVVMSLIASATFDNHALWRSRR